MDEFGESHPRNQIADGEQDEGLFFQAERGSDRLAILARGKDCAIDASGDHSNTAGLYAVAIEHTPPHKVAQHDDSLRTPDHHSLGPAPRQRQEPVPDLPSYAVLRIIPRLKLLVRQGQTDIHHWDLRETPRNS